MTTNNHPAHGPVSLDRLHQIREILSKAAAQSDGGNLGYAMADAVKVIAGVIAAFDAEPVAYADQQTFDNFKSNGGKNAACTKEWMWRDPSDGLIPLYTAPPAPVVDADDNFYSWFGREWEQYYQPNNYSLSAKKHLGAIAESAWFACRAAMLQGAEPASNCDELPLDYLQGHKDGLEWAAQLAEANHPQTGDWLYDDPIELARAIRKGPDMPEFKSVSVDEDDNFYSWFGRFWYENYQQNNYTASAKQMLGTMAEFAYRAGRESAARAGNSPVTPDCWIPVSERMPENKPGSYEYIVFESLNNRAHHDYWNVPDSSCDDFAPFWNHYGKYVTHWMPLPAAPKQEVKSALEHGMQRYAGAMQKLSERDK